MDLPTGFLAGFTESGKELKPILVISENILALVSVVHDARPAVAPSKGG
jgi:hypothetical protein